MSDIKFTSGVKIHEQYMMERPVSYSNISSHLNLIMSDKDITAKHQELYETPNGGQSKAEKILIRKSQFPGSNEPHFSGSEPQFSGDKLQYSESESQFGGSKPQFSGRTPLFSGHPQFGGPKLQFNGPKPQFNGHKPQFSGHKPQFNGRQHNSFSAVHMMGSPSSSQTPTSHRFGELPAPRQTLTPARQTLTPAGAISASVKPAEEISNQAEQLSTNGYDFSASNLTSTGEAAESDNPTFTGSLPASLAAANTWNFALSCSADSETEAANTDASPWTTYR